MLHAYRAGKLVPDFDKDMAFVAGRLVTEHDQYRFICDMYIAGLVPSARHLRCNHIRPIAKGMLALYFYGKLKCEAKASHLDPNIEGDANYVVRYFARSQATIKRAQLTASLILRSKVHEELHDNIMGRLTCSLRVLAEV